MKNLYRLTLFITLFILLGLFFSQATVNYINTEAPDINLHFDEEINITFSELNDEEIKFNPDGFSDSFTYSSEIDDEGSHYLNISAVDRDGRTFKEEYFSYTFHLDFSSPHLVDSEPADDASLNVDSNTIDIVLYFNQNIRDEAFDVSLAEGNGEIVNETYERDELEFKLNFDHSDNFSINYQVEDLAGNENEGSIDFSVSRDLYITSDDDFYSSSSDYDLELETNNEAYCKYYKPSNEESIEQVNITEMEDFQETGEEAHSSEISGLDVGSNSLYVHCNCATTEETLLEEVIINYMDSPPNIGVLSGDVLSTPLESNIEVFLDEESKCAYGENNESFSDMEFQTDGYVDNLSIQKSVEDSQEYKYFIKCKNKAGLVGEVYTNFVVNSSANLTVDITSPFSYYQNSLPIDIQASTNYHVICQFAKGTDNLVFKERDSFGNPNIYHSTEAEFPSGSNYLHVKCFPEGGEYEVLDSEEFFLDTLAPYISEVEFINLNEGNADPTEVDVNVTAEDDLSGIDIYSFKRKSTNESYSTDWFNSTSHRVSFADNESLSKEEAYWYEVKVYNKAGLESEIFESDSIGFNESHSESFCEDGEFDPDTQTDVDCGYECPPCEDGKSCIEDSDCISENCIEGVCKGPSCDDGRKNGEQTDVDCGGPNCPPCEVGQSCLSDSDCKTENCVEGTCEEGKCNDGQIGPGQTDVDCGGDCPPCDDGKRCENDHDCRSGNCENNICVEEVPPEIPPNDDNGDPGPEPNGNGNGEPSPEEERGLGWLLLLVILLVVIIGGFTGAYYYDLGGFNNKINNLFSNNTGKGKQKSSNNLGQNSQTPKSSKGQTVNRNLQKELYDYLQTLKKSGPDWNKERELLKKGATKQQIQELHQFVKKENEKRAQRNKLFNKLK